MRCRSFLLCWPWFFYEHSRVTDQSFVRAGWFTGMAILSKTWPFILAPILFFAPYKLAAEDTGYCACGSAGTFGYFAV
jgi:hypothetical protein